MNLTNNIVMKFVTITGTMRSGTTLAADLFGYCEQNKSIRNKHLLILSEKHDNLPYLVRRVFKEFHDTTNIVKFIFPLLKSMPAHVDQTINSMSIEIPKARGIKLTNFWEESKVLNGANPYAYSLIMIRDPRDVYSSHVTRRKESSYEQHISIIIDMIELYLFLEHEKSSHMRKLIIKYEDLVSAPLDTISQIFLFLGVEYCDEDIDYLNYSKLYKNSSYSSLGGALGCNKFGIEPSVGKYKFYLSKSDIHLIQVIFSKQMGIYGYPKDRVCRDVKYAPYLCRCIEIIKRKAEKHNKVEVIRFLDALKPSS